MPGRTIRHTIIDPCLVQYGPGGVFHIDLYGHGFDSRVGLFADPSPALNISVSINATNPPHVASQVDITDRQSFQVDITNRQSSQVDISEGQSLLSTASGQDPTLLPGHLIHHFVTSPSSMAHICKYYVVVVGKCAGVFTFW